jgi:hypothetical protein|tara:strand:+ start:310 stop:723 length:414 start_codon:yes stop_codon:yes gene_type:complete
MADPILLVQPLISINSVDMVCYARSVKMTASDDMQDIATFCTPNATRPGSTTWDVEIEFAQSYDTAGTDVFNTLLAIAKTAVAVEIRPATGAVAVTNPQANFTAYIPTPTFLDGGVGESQTFTMTLRPNDDPVFTTA